jgi:ribose transport system permease protein
MLRGDSDTNNIYGNKVLMGIRKCGLYLWNKQKALLALLGIAVVFAFLSEYFFTLTNLMNVSRQISTNAMLAAGMTLVILMGDIDLSVGSNASFCGVVAAFLLKRGVDTPWTFLLILCLGAIIGFINGTLITKVGVPFFIGTLAMMSILTGGGFLITGGYPISLLPQTWKVFGRGHLGLVPVSVIIMIFVFVILQIMLGRTSFGRKIYAVGSSERTSRMCGIKTERIRIMAYSICGLLAAVGGVLLSSRIDSGDPSVGGTFLLTAIAAPILGGTKLSGGEGTIVGTLIGALVLGVINNAMSLINLNTYWQDVVRGLIVLAIVIPQIERKKL